MLSESSDEVPPSEVVSSEEKLSEVVSSDELGKSSDELVSDEVEKSSDEVVSEDVEKSSDEDDVLSPLLSDEVLDRVGSQSDSVSLDDSAITARSIRETWGGGVNDLFD